VLLHTDKTQVTNTDTLEPLDAAGNPIDAPFTVVDSSSLVGYTAGLYLQDEWRLTKSLTLNAGIRFDQYWEYISEYQFSPRVSWVAEICGDTKSHFRSWVWAPSIPSKSDTPHARHSKVHRSGNSINLRVVSGQLHGLSPAWAP
jgi:outer membrane receptor protein involved in Fe transport